MKSILNPKDTLTNKISYYHLVLFAAALPFDQFYSQVVLTSLILHTLIHARREDWMRLLRKEVLMLSSVFLVTMICTIYTDNTQEAFSLLSRQLAIFIFPIVLFMTTMDIKKYAKNILLIFAFVCTFVVSFLYIDALRVVHYYHLPLSSLFSPLFMNHQFSEPIGMHATYLSLYVFISIIVVVQYGLSARRTGLKIIYAIVGIILLAGLVQLGSRACLIALFIALCFVIPFLLHKKRRLFFSGFSVLLTIFIVVAILSIDSFKNRFIETLKEDLSEAPVPGSTIDSRMKRWDVAFELVKASPLVGYGTGDEVELLKEEYFSHRLYNAYINNLNAHNQYISFLLMGGLFALTVYLLTVLSALRLAIKSRNIIFIGFLILLLVVSLSENILTRNKGIFFYSFFFSFFVCMEKGKAIGLRKPKQVHRVGNQRRDLYVSTNKI